MAKMKSCHTKNLDNYQNFNKTLPVLITPIKLKPLPLSIFQ